MSLDQQTDFKRYTPPSATQLQILQYLTWAGMPRHSSPYEAEYSTYRGRHRETRFRRITRKAPR